MKSFFKKWRPYLIFGALFSMFINALQLTFPIYMLQIYDRVLSSYSMPTLYAITLAAIVSLIVMAALEFVRSRLLVRCGVAIDQALSRDVLDSVLKQAVNSTPAQQQASLRDVNVLRNFFGGNAIFTLFDIPWTPLFLAAIYILHPLLGLVATGGAVLLIVFAVINEKVTRQPLDAANTVNGFSAKFVEAARRNAQTVYSMGMMPGVTQRWQEFNDTVTKLQTQASRQAGMVQSLSGWLRQSMQVFIYGVGAWLTLEGQATAGCMIASSIVMGKALAPVQMGIGSWKSMIEARGAWKRLDALFSQPKPEDGMDLPAPQGELTAEHASFAIQGNAILRDIHFVLPAGESLGLIGPSGAGKSTLCRLLLGLWPASAGKVRLDGHDIYAWQQEKLGPYLGYLPQDIELFSGTIAENIARLGTVDSEEVIRAAQQAGVHELILSLPKGYDTRVGEGGQTLSGGQRQRIGLARALYGRPRLVILDEPNSNLDDEGEGALLRSFAALKEQGTTLVVVSHKPALLAGMDKLLLLKAGQMSLYGPRDAVLAKLMEARNAQQVAG
ncbi:type I secretion system permease/ATPase [Desulfuromonas thiophila]|uniref:ATP-binding cassette, subfamily C, EexD n=1 Tax=Desulfuromonas thiophila TaxID=57664 RepID=A0A1G7BU59_9BACT|nr:type I secretion system permease/ATPase [Desulfuromonas thiophila]SDE30599.1 ATP-binding cassette, subfamily C, EexD [Desulfuromonas thiophila]